MSRDNSEKKWGKKVRDDVKKAHDTGRNYKVVFFVSSRSIRAKDKARVQDELSEKYNIDVRILDRTWILDEVFENNREDIVNEELHISNIVETKIKKGPLDLQREEDLESLDKKIKTAISENKINPSTVKDAIESAVLSRELEKPRVEIDGRFVRAERLAKKCGNIYQQFEVAYQNAWTTFWWYEDFSTYIDMYKQAEKIVVNLENVYNLERQINLWFCLNNLCHQVKGVIDKNLLDTHTKILKDQLAKISKEKEKKPSASLYARTLLFQIELAERRYSGEKFGKTLIGLKETVVESRNLIGFPFKSIVDVLTEISEALDDIPEYKDLFNTILEVTEERDGELAAAKLLLDRGKKLIRKDRYYEAIQELGKSLRKLYKYESRNEVVWALYFIGIAYEQVGLFWAARGSILSAASLATNDFWDYGDINTMQAVCYERLKWLELRLGRIPQALDWHRLDYTVRKILLEQGFDAKKLFGQINRFDVALGILFLRSDLETLKSFEYLPDTLFELGLDCSQVALLYALGCEEQIPKDFSNVIPPDETKDFFIQMAKKYSPEYLPLAITSTERDNVKLTSKILGCEAIVNVENQPPCIETAESILSAIESFLSTTILRHAVACEAIIELNIDSKGKNDLIEYEIDDRGDNPTVSVHCNKFNPHSISNSDQEKLRDIILNTISGITGRIIIFKDPDIELKEIMQDERATDRALIFTSSFITLGNVLGHEPKIKIFEWIDKKKKKYELRRHEPLRFPQQAKQKTCEVLTGSLSDDPFIQPKHTDVQIISIIRNTLWDEANWQGTGYLISPNNEQPPVLGIIFTNIEVGKKIFAEWKEKIGNKDKEDQIRVSIVQGINQDNPYHYRVGIGSNIKPPEKEGERSRFVT
jgi:tetratricopeptide (TPR) repeat protein